MKLKIRSQNGRTKKKSGYAEKNNPLNRPKEGSTKSTPVTSESTMVLEYPTSKNVQTDSSVLYVLVMEEELNLTLTDTVTEILSRNSTVGL